MSAAQDPPGPPLEISTCPIVPNVDNITASSVNRSVFWTPGGPNHPPLPRDLANLKFPPYHLCGFITALHKATRWIYVGARYNSHVAAPPEHPNSLYGRGLSCFCSWVGF